MINIPLSAKVECSDGPCGKSVTVIVNPVTHELTHFVVEDKGLPQRLVPVEYVEETTSDLVRLNCTRAQVEEMEPFLETQYVKGQVYMPVSPAYDQYYMAPYVLPMDVEELPVEVERVPPGKLAIHRGTLVEASDGYVGTIDEMLLDPKSGHITHLVLREGHLWGKKEVTLPISAIDRVMMDTVYLKLDKKGVGLLPSIPVKRHYATGESKRKKVALMAKVFDDPDQAGKALEFIEKQNQIHTLQILNAAVLVKDQDGKTSLTDTRDIDPKKGRLLGAITGGLIGLVGGPVGVVVGALAGAGAGSLAGKWLDFGFSDTFLTNLKQHLQPGTSALIILVEHEWVRPVSDVLEGMDGVVLQETLADFVVEQLLEGGEAEA